jgi:hypothetical protein
MFSTLSKSQYKVVSRGALPTTVRPRIEPSIEAVLNMDIQTTKDKRFGRKVTTAKTRIG